MGCGRLRIHPLTRRMVSTLSRLITKQRALADEDVVSPGQLVWRGLSAAVVSQAASHHLRHAVALSAPSAAEPVEDILGNSNASPDVSGMSDTTLEAEGDISLGQAGGKAADGAGSGCAAISGGRQDSQAAFVSGAAAEDLCGTPPTALTGHEPHGPPPGSAEMAAGKAAVGAGGGCAAISGGR